LQLAAHPPARACPAATVAPKGPRAAWASIRRPQDWIGKPFGVRVTSKPPQKGWVHLLAPTAELWTLALRHRTQILYVADIAMVVAGLDLRPGSTVLESGTGGTSSAPVGWGPRRHLGLLAAHGTPLSQLPGSSLHAEGAAAGAGGPPLSLCPPLPPRLVCRQRVAEPQPGQGGRAHRQSAHL
jgi:hypothetical protein